jgi:hypothetical protein
MPYRVYVFVAAIWDLHLLMISSFSTAQDRWLEILLFLILKRFNRKRLKLRFKGQDVKHN